MKISHKQDLAKRLGQQKENPSDLCGQVLWGANNIFLVACEDGRERKCRLRGKTLEHDGLEHNPLVCGDFVLLEGHSGQIYHRLERDNILRRRNLKRGEPQAFAANVDGVILMVSWSTPPLRPAFLDRMLIAAKQTQVPIQVLVNKVDCIHSLKELLQLYHHLRQYRKIGVPISAISLVSPVWKGQSRKPFRQLLVLLYYTGVSKWILRKLRRKMSDALCVILGASGVGKSTLCNYFFPDQPQETRAISEKWQRGVHTTTLARTLESKEGYRLIDTPGMRNFLPEITAEQLQGLQDYYPEFYSLRKRCSYSACQHRMEPDCAVREAADYGFVPRYQSYINLYNDLEESLKGKPIYQTQNKKKGRGLYGENKRSKERKHQRSKVQLKNHADGSFELESD